MNAADSSETTIAFVEEETFGITPASPAWQKFRMTGESLNYDITNTQSNEITPNADVTDLIQTGASVSGAINFELSHGSADMDIILEHALRGTFTSNILKAAIEKKSLSLEKIFELGATDSYFRYYGNRVNQLNLTVQAGAIINGNVNVMGLGATLGTAALSGATYGNANTNDVMTAIDVAQIAVGGIGSEVFYTDLSFSLNNNCRAQGAVGSLPAVGIGYGQRVITGTMNAYFESQALYQAFINGTSSSLTFTATDGTRNYVFTFPKIKFATGQVQAGGNNQDVFANMTWQALRDSSAGCSMQVENQA